MSRRRREKGKINVVNLSNYTSPEIKVTKDKSWVTYGTKNEYFSYLLDRYSGSPTNNAIINIHFNFKNLNNRIHSYHRP